MKQNARKITLLQLYYLFKDNISTCLKIRFISPHKDADQLDIYYLDLVQRSIKASAWVEIIIMLFKYLILTNLQELIITLAK